MKRKPKRRYVRTVLLVPKPLSEENAPQSTTEPLSGGSSIIPQAGEVVAPIIEFTFKDLPLSLRMQVESVIKWRKAKGLPDDSEERKEKAIKMFRGDRPR